MLVICLSQKRPDGGNGYPIPPGLTVALSIGVSFATADVDLVHPLGWEARLTFVSPSSVSGGHDALDGMAPEALAGLSALELIRAPYAANEVK
jgi:hypothetical protein